MNRSKALKLCNDVWKDTLSQCGLDRKDYKIHSVFCLDCAEDSTYWCESSVNADGMKIIPYDDDTGYRCRIGFNTHYTRRYGARKVVNLLIYKHRPNSKTVSDFCKVEYQQIIRRT